MKGERTKHSPAFKTKVALAARREEAIDAELSRRQEIHANQIYKWKRQALENLERAFEAENGGEDGASERELERLQRLASWR